jgi:uncharacterized damage-inducible protein DinB
VSRIQIALDQIVTARNYSLSLIDATNPSDWFRQPKEGVTHLAWQVAHLATAEYWLALNRTRGTRPADEELIPEAFRKQFGRESTPDPNPANNPTPAEIRGVFDRVHQQVLDEVTNFPESICDEPLSRPHRMFSTKISALQWCSQHEFIHAGQIALLRRLLGSPPVW